MLATWSSATPCGCPRRRPGSAATIVLVILLSVVLTALLVIGVLYLSGVFTVVVQDMEPFVQTGSVRTATGQEGDVKFPVPYASPPNVELSGSSWNNTIIVETTNLGFRWKNAADPKDRQWNDGSMTWTAKGIRAMAVPR